MRFMGKANNMKRPSFAVLLVALVLTGCVQRPAATNSHDSNEPLYYAYDPEDTIGNEPYWHMLRIDSARVEILSDPRMAMTPSTRIKKLVGDSVVFVDNDGNDTSAYDAAKAKWHELMHLCSRMQYEDVLSMYGKEETKISLALASSTNKYYLDYYVIGRLLFDRLEEDEATERFVKFLEYDMWLTELEVWGSTAEGGSGYIPPHYSDLIGTLGAMYMDLGDESKAEELIEPFRNAVYLLSDDVWTNEQQIAVYKISIYHSVEDYPKLKAALEDYRAFVIDYSKTSGENHEDVVGRLDVLIKDLE